MPELGMQHHQTYKVQRPMASSDEAQPWLFYNKDRTVEFELADKDIPKRLSDMMGSRFKIYCTGRLVSDLQKEGSYKFELAGPAKWQNW